MDAQLRQLVWQRASSRCEDCRVPADVALLPFQIDHIIAEKHGGLTVADNLALSCERCNSHKGPNIAGYLEGRSHCLIPERTAGRTILRGKVRCWLGRPLSVK